jgi:hypothetical protein
MVDMGMGNMAGMKKGGMAGMDMSGVDGMKKSDIGIRRIPIFFLDSSPIVEITK